MVIFTPTYTYQFIFIEAITFVQNILFQERVGKQISCVHEIHFTLWLFELEFPFPFYFTLSGKK
jgi:hypothetical protein